MPENIIETFGLTKTYIHNKHRVEVLKDVDLNLCTGESLAIVGPSGAGKSTLLYLIGLLEKPTEGRLQFNKIDVNKMPDRDRSRIRLESIGFIFQFHHLLPEFTAIENVMLPGMMLSKKPDECETFASGLLSQVGLSKRLDHKPGELSGGEQQRVAFARALMNSPELILADEPTGNLDRAASQVLENMMWDMCRDRNTALMIVTHNEYLAEGADKVIKLVDGLIVD